MKSILDINLKIGRMLVELKTKRTSSESVEDYQKRMDEFRTSISALEWVIDED